MITNIPVVLSPYGMDNAPVRINRSVNDATSYENGQK
jgi:hypothetical protein